MPEIRYNCGKMKIMCKELHALKDYFGPTMRSKYENCFSLNSCYFIRTMVQVYKSGIDLTFNVAMVTKWPPNRIKIGN